MVFSTDYFAKIATIFRYVIGLSQYMPLHVRHARTT